MTNGHALRTSKKFYFSFFLPKVSICFKLSFIVLHSVFDWKTAGSRCVKNWKDSSRKMIKPCWPQNIWPVSAYRARDEKRCQTQSPTQFCHWKRGFLTLWDELMSILFEAYWVTWAATRMRYLTDVPPTNSHFHSWNARQEEVAAGQTSAFCLVCFLRQVIAK